MLRLRLAGRGLHSIQRTGTDDPTTAEDPGGADPEHHTAEPVIYLTDKARHGLQSRQGSRRPDTYNSQTAGIDRQKGGTMDISKLIEFTKEVREQDRDLKALAVRDIEKESQQARDRFIERTKSMESAQKYDAYSNCMMSTALLLVDRWGARFIPDICDALQLEQEELESTLNETDVLECIDLEGRETGTNAADDGTKSGTGAADPGTVSEIMKRLNRVEESLHSIGQQVEAIWLKTGAVELDAESIAEDLEETDTEQ